ncbi:MAG TPA: putative DNA-binding domain-containing protein [Fibrobacteria bacterium]|nr:putative DNA-binding domain-containing protein [Fibrobacteria bacterium]
MTKTVSNRAKAPAGLKDFQRWMGRASARPLLAGNATVKRGVDGVSLRAEADKRLRSRNGMSGLERLEVYNRQYWFRLITIMQEEYPCALHVIGLDAFNGWVIKYLDANPPASPYLATLDAGFPAFLRRRYRGKNRERVLEAAAYDKALSRAFDGPIGARPPPGEASNPKARWMLAAHVTPLWLHWDFASYRTLCREDEALTAKIPLKRTGKNGQGCVAHRHENTIYEKPVTRAEFLLLDALTKPRALAQVFATAGRGASAREKGEMARNAGAWFREWTELGWVGPAAG